MYTGLKCRIYPTEEQKAQLRLNFSASRKVWNNSLEAIQQIYKETGKGLTYFKLTVRITALKKEIPWLKEASSRALEGSVKNLDQAFKNFFNKTAKYPKFKSYKHHKSVKYQNDMRILNDKSIYIPKIGAVSAVIAREVVGKTKTAVVSEAASGRWYASFTIDDGLPAPEVSHDGKWLAIDVGLKHIAVTSDGAKFENPKWFANAQKNLKRKQQALARKKAGSRGRDKARIMVAKRHEDIANMRKDYLHKLSHQLIKDNQVIAVENLNINGMVKNHCLAKAISDVSWGTLKTNLKYKAEKYGKGFIKVDRFYPSSKTCSNCGFIFKKLTLNIRKWRCVECGVLHDRDINAAINICAEAQRNTPALSNSVAGN